MRTDYGLTERQAQRHRHASPEEIELISLAAELRGLAAKYPRFMRSLNKLKFTVELQLAKPAEKERRVRRALTQTRLLTLEELVIDTCLDEISTQQTVRALVASGELEECDRTGGSIGGKGAGKGWRSRVYYQMRRPPNRPPDDDAELELSIVVGSSQRVSPKG